MAASWRAEWMEFSISHSDASSRMSRGRVATRLCLSDVRAVTLCVCVILSSGHVR